MNKLAYLEGYLSKRAGNENWDVTGPMGTPESQTDKGLKTPPKKVVPPKKKAPKKPYYPQPNIKGISKPKTRKPVGDADTANDANDIFKGTGIKPGKQGYVDATQGK